MDGECLEKQCLLRRVDGYRQCKTTCSRVRSFRDYNTINNLDIPVCCVHLSPKQAGLLMYYLPTLLRNRRYR